MVEPARAATSVRPVQRCCAEARYLVTKYLRLLDRRAALWLTVAHSTERWSLGASYTCTA
jgi:hypothetical protein